MWKTLSDWLLAFLNMARELEENRASIRRFETRLRDQEAAIKLLALELRHARELESSEREKLFLRLQQELARFKELSSPRGRKSE
jgi:competence protein ComGF